MLWCSLSELSLIIGLISIILYGLFSLSMNSVFSNEQVRESGVSLKYVNLYLSDVYFFSRLWPVMLLLGSLSNVDLFLGLSTSNIAGLLAYPYNNGIDVLLILLTVVIMQSFRSFESILLLLLAFIGQLFMLHSCDLVSFYICLEVQNFCFLVLCGLQPRVLKYNVPTSTLPGTPHTENGNTHFNGQGPKVIGSRPLAGVEASIKYLLLSAFSSGVLLFWFSALYLRTGITTLSWGPLTSNSFGVDSSAGLMDVIPQLLILLALMFKLGGAPLHLWMIDIYSGVKRQLLMYISTAPKLSLFGFWISTWHSVWTDFTILIFVAFSMIIGCFGAYSQPTLRSLFAYSTVNEIGLLLLAVETAGFHSLLQHLTIYIITMLLLWNNSDKRLFGILAVSLAGLPPLAGFFGKAWIFNSVATGAMSGPYLGLLIISLFCTGLSLVYYLRVFRLFSMGKNQNSNNVIGMGHNMGIETRTYGYSVLDLNIKLTSFCVIFLFFAPLFYIKPFVL
uniref:NADH dehydrogenase subunit 2 n=1 Tax=Limnomonas spitsbergensis TaxID=2954232 RepID=UPI002552060C|nr:NADH dehydrogenase subunit 2 [Limnomonas spitsbergensis]WEV87805.1 NADH dehydrogenase subunit 2 [Limnomonas spitsbergensis]